MKNEHIASVLRPVVQEAWKLAETDLTKAKELVIAHLSTTSIKDIDKNRMIESIKSITDSKKFIFSTTNFLLKYEGFGVIKF